ADADGSGDANRDSEPTRAWPLLYQMGPRPARRSAAVELSMKCGGPRMRSLGTRSVWTVSAIVASLATAPCVFAQTSHAHQARSQPQHQMATAGQATGTAAPQPGVIAPGGMPPGGTDTNGGATGAVGTPGMPSGAITDTTGRTGTAYGTYDQPAGGGGHNWG